MKRGQAWVLAPMLVSVAVFAGCAGEAKQDTRRPRPDAKSSGTGTVTSQNPGQETTTPHAKPAPPTPKVDPIPAPPEVRISEVPATRLPDELPDELPTVKSFGPVRGPFAVNLDNPAEEPAPTAPVSTTPVRVEPPATTTRTAAGGGEGFARVTVFYGTDRAPAEPGEPDRLAAVRWHYGTLASATATILLASLACFRPKSRAARWLAGAGLTVTVLLGGLTIWSRAHPLSGEPDPGRFYGNGRGELAFGTCEVSIPARHETGELERPSIFRLELAENPLKHVVLLEVNPQTPDEFFEGCRKRVAQSARGEALVFVHGYNVTFEDAARRTAQLAYDLDVDGPAVFFSWPSQGGLLRYAVDETNVAWAVPDLKQFLLDVARKSGARSVHLIAHSMGNRALASALCNLSYEAHGGSKVFREVVLTAPDIDAEVFRREIAPAIVKTAERVTLYASGSDEALAVSKKLHGYPRAGDAGDSVVVVPGIDTIDVSAVEEGLLGHSYYGDNRAVLADLALLLHEGTPSQDRPWLRPKAAGPLRYWVLAPAEMTRSPGGLFSR